MKLDTRLSIPPQVMSRLVGSDTVLLDLASWHYFGVEGVGKLIWESVSDVKTLAETVDAIVDEFDVEKSQAVADVSAFASQLVERGLLVE